MNHKVSKELNDTAVQVGRLIGRVNAVLDQFEPQLAVLPRLIKETLVDIAPTQFKDSMRLFLDARTRDHAVAGVAAIMAASQKYRTECQEEQMQREKRDAIRNAPRFKPDTKIL